MATPAKTAVPHHEKTIRPPSGWVMFVVLLLLSLGVTGAAVYAFANDAPLSGALWSALVLLALFLWSGMFTIEPNQAKVLQLFGSYVGTAKEPGLRWANPLYSKEGVSLRVRNFESDKLKVNDQRGSPIEIAAVVVWRVVDTAEAVFEVDRYEEFVSIQSESALRNLANIYPYEDHEAGELSLRGDPAGISEALKKEVQDRLDKAGVEVLEARITHLAYAPEIANAMLRRQQASAVIAAREKMVSGAVSMVEMALAELSAKNVVELDPERRASMVSNLLVVLCAEENAQPVVNAGTLYS
ncbi:MAG: SPFH domain-containing protein [Pseudomonadota bacterium]